MTGETIAAIATAPGPAGVAVVRVSGSDAFAVAGRLTRGRFTPPVGPQPQAQVLALFAPTVSDVASVSSVPSRPHVPVASHVSRVAGGSREDDRRQTRDDDGGKSAGFLDKAVVLAFRAPRSYTGEDVVEFQCHGGAVTPRRVLEAAFAAGARLARRGEFTERAFLNGKLDYDQAEGVLDLIHAKTERAADAAQDAIAGRRRRESRELYDRALDLSSTLEHALDVDESELPESFFSSLAASFASLDAALAAASKRLRESRILRDGALVVLAGPPNAGKSSLLNALVGESRAIVSDVPGTTRDAVEAWVDFDGWPIRLVDTAGLRETADAIEQEGVKRAEELIEKADVVIRLIGRDGDERDQRDESDQSDSDVRGERGVRDGGLTPPQRLAQPKAISINAKCDLSRSPSLLNVSAKTGEGVDSLRREIVAALERRAAATATEASSDAPDDRALSVLCEARGCLAPFVASAAPLDLVLAANAARAAAEALGSLVGATYSADLLDRLFSRFCVGK